MVLFGEVVESQLTTLFSCSQLSDMFSEKPPLLKLVISFGRIRNLISAPRIETHLQLFQAMKNCVALIATLIGGIVQIASGAVTLQISAEYENGIASNFANQAGVVTNGMQYGVVISTSDTSFSAGLYDPMSPSVYATGGFLFVGGVATDDYYVPGGLTFNTTEDTEGDFTTPGGNGTIGLVSNIPVTPDSGAVASAGDLFALIWFSSNSANSGDYYGFMTDVSFTMPSTGTVDRSSPFVGADPIRSATFQFDAIPEPSRAVLLGLAGGLALFRRRRIA